LESAVGVILSALASPRSEMAQIKSASDVHALISTRAALVKTDEETLEQALANTMACFQAGAWQKAFFMAVEIAACVEARSKQDGYFDGELHASAVHNIATALHHLGKTDAARSFYEEAVQELSEVPKGGFLILCCLPDIRNQQLMFMQSRYALLREGRKPDERTYLNGEGEEAQWTEEEMAKARKVVEALEADAKQAAQTPSKKPAMGFSLNVDATKHLGTGTSYPVGSTPRGQLW
jgi:hypothetical protein